MTASCLENKIIAFWKL